MADGEELAGCIGLVLVVIVVVLAVAAAVAAFATIGAAYGAGLSLWNYGLAFANNVRPERARR